MNILNLQQEGQGLFAVSTCLNHHLDCFLEAKEFSLQNFPPHIFYAKQLPRLKLLYTGTAVSNIVRSLHGVRWVPHLLG